MQDIGVIFLTRLKKDASEATRKSLGSMMRNLWHILDRYTLPMMCEKPANMIVS